MVFQRRIEFKVVYGAILAGQILILFLNDGFHTGEWHTYATLLLSAALGCMLLNEVVGYSRIDNDGLFIRSLFGSRLVKWSDIANIDFWSEADRMNSGLPDHPHIRVALQNGKSLSINSVYQLAFIEHLQNEAKTRGLLQS